MILTVSTFCRPIFPCPFSLTCSLLLSDTLLHPAYPTISSPCSLQPYPSYLSHFFTCLSLHTHTDQLTLRISLTVHPCSACISQPSLSPITFSAPSFLVPSSLSLSHMPLLVHLFDPLPFLPCFLWPALAHPCLTMLFRPSLRLYTPTCYYINVCPSVCFSYIVFLYSSKIVIKDCC